MVGLVSPHGAPTPVPYPPTDPIQPHARAKGLSTPPRPHLPSSGPPPSHPQGARACCDQPKGGCETMFVCLCVCVCVGGGGRARAGRQRVQDGSGSGGGRPDCAPSDPSSLGRGAARSRGPARPRGRHGTAPRWRRRASLERSAPSSRSGRGRRARGPPPPQPPRPAAAAPAGGQSVSRREASRLPRTPRTGSLYGDVVECAPRSYGSGPSSRLRRRLERRRWRWQGKSRSFARSSSRRQESRNARTHARTHTHTHAHPHIAVDNQAMTRTLLKRWIFVI